MSTQKEQLEFLTAYLDCALFFSGSSLPPESKFSPDTLAVMTADALNFYNRLVKVEKGCTMKFYAYCFWFLRNGYDIGHWDGHEGSRNDRLRDLVHNYPKVRLYLAADGYVHIDTRNSYLESYVSEDGQEPHS